MFKSIVISVILFVLVDLSAQIKTAHEIYNIGSCSIPHGSAGGSQNAILEIPSLGPETYVDNVLDFGYTLTEATRKTSSKYVAGVVEYFPSMSLSPEIKIKQNMQQYLRFISEAQKQDVDILVFPESTLNSASGNRSAAARTTTEVPDPVERHVPCNQLNTKYLGAYDEILVPLSCAAKQKKMYVVVNLSEQALCTPESQAQANDSRPCAHDTRNFYNTDVVFDRTGAVVARYRKFNLFGERNYNTTKTAEHITFDTDFGVRFGLFTCFDIMFNEPALGLVRDGVKDFIFPTMWFSEMPFLTALQIQEYWSYTNDVNLLASGASNTLIGSGGSGIYAGVRGPLVNYMSIPGRDNDKLLVARVPKLRNAVGQDMSNDIFQQEEDPNMDAFYMKRDEIDDYTSEVIGERFYSELCSGELCCTFNVTSIILDKTEGKESYQYRAIVGDVVRTFTGVAHGGIKSCAIVACSGADYKHCARRFPISSKVAPRQIFHNINIEGNFPAIDEMLTMPNTLTHAMKPLPTGSIAYNEDRNERRSMKHVSLYLSGSPVDNLQTFSIYGRDFRGDGRNRRLDLGYFEYNSIQSL